MAVAVWVLGDSEAEIRAELARLRLEPAGRPMLCGGRARLMQRATTLMPEVREHPEQH